LTKAWVKEEFMVAASIGDGVPDPRGAEYTMCDYIMCDIHFSKGPLKPQFEAKGHYFMTAADAADPFLSQMKMSLDDVLSLLKSYDITVVCMENEFTDIDMGKLAMFRAEVEKLAVSGPMDIKTVEKLLVSKLKMQPDMARYCAKNYDTSNDGKISVMELFSGLEGEAQASKVKEIFKKWDKNKDGNIDEDELHAMMVKLMKAQGKTWENYDTYDLWRECDKSGDGKISLTEFVNVVFSLKKQ